MDSSHSRSCESRVLYSCSIQQDCRSSKTVSHGNFTIAHSNRDSIACGVPCLSRGIVAPPSLENRFRKHVSEFRCIMAAARFQSQLSDAMGCQVRAAREEV